MRRAKGFRRWLRKMEESQWNGDEVGLIEKLLYGGAEFLFFIIFGVCGFWILGTIVAYAAITAGVAIISLIATAYDWFGAIPIVAAGLMFIALLGFMFMGDHREHGSNGQEE